MITTGNGGETAGRGILPLPARNQLHCKICRRNGAPLTYDLNGNLTAYGDTQYSWSRGKQLSSISDGENSYTYQYDSKGIRASKTVNGVTTNYDTLDGRILAQYDGTNNIYFQYNGDSPVGFILNNVQYYYITNLYGDVMGIADSDGSVIARYSYDEWGKPLDIATAQENSEEQMAIAELNPLRYRGYYYDNETGMYYLQSRYYNPDLCRFISADGFDYINSYDYFGRNAYIYCCNNPVYYNDPNGTKHKDKDGNFDLGYKGWKYRFENNQGGYKKSHGKRHVHLENERLGKSYSQNEDGSPHDKNKNSPGSPPKKVKEELKKQTGWNWDAKQKAYNEKQKKNSNNYNFNFNFDFDFSNVGDVVVFAIILSLLIVAVGTGLIFILLFLEILPPAGIPA